MKRNLIIFLFTLLLGGISCFNYSYASTVNVSESFCKNIQNNYASLETDNEINAMLDDFCKSNPCTDSQKALMRESYSSSKSHYQDEWGNENKEKIKEVCNAAT